MITRREFAIAGAALVSAPLAQAQSFPSRPIKMIVPFPPGGTADIQARLIGQHMSQTMGQPIVIESKPGGGTIIGTGFVAKSPADGYTVLLMANSFVINAKLHGNTLPYEGMKAFEPIACMTNSPQVIAVNAASPHRTFKEWVDAAKAKPGTHFVRHRRPGHHPAHRRRDAAARDRHQADLRAVRRRHPGGQFGAGRPRRHGARQFLGNVGAPGGRQIASAGGDHDCSAWTLSSRCPPSPSRAIPATRRRPGSACRRRPARRATWWRALAEAVNAALNDAELRKKLVNGRAGAVLQGTGRLCRAHRAAVRALRQGHRRSRHQGMKAAGIEQQVLQWLGQSHDAMVALLRRIVDIDSGSYDKAGVDSVVAALREFLEANGVACEVRANASAGNCMRAVVKDTSGSAERPVILMGHCDTVFPKGTVAQRPFRIDGDLAHGPGVADMKSGLVINSFVLAALAKAGAPLPLVGLYTSDEEIASPASRDFIEKEVAGARAVLNAEPARPTGNLVTGRKGALFIEFEVTGVPAHSGVNHQEGASAIDAVCRKVLKLHGLTDYDSRHHRQCGPGQRRQLDQYRGTDRQGLGRRALQDPGRDEDRAIPAGADHR